MREAGLCAKGKRHRVITTRSDPSHPVASNIFNRDFTATEPNTKWATDITSIPTVQGWFYLAGILDLYSRAVVGWSMSASCDEELVAKAFQMAAFAAQPLDVALTFISSLSPETVAHLLEERIGLLEDLVTNLEAQQQQLPAVAPPVQAIIADIFTHTRDRFQAERAWAAYLLERVRNGSYTVQNDLNHSPCEEK